MPGLVRDWGRIKGKPTQYLYMYNNGSKLAKEQELVTRLVLPLLVGAGRHRFPVVHVVGGSSGITIRGVHR